MAARTWIQTEGIILSGMSQTEKDKYGMPYLYVESKKFELTEIESRLAVSRVWKLEKMGAISQSTHIFCNLMNKFWGSNI